jgi:hypothetical protein
MSVLAQIASLPVKNTQELNELWRKLFESDPPQAGKQYLIRRLAYRLQELAHGGLNSSAATILDGLSKPQVNGARSILQPDTALPIPGARLIREWHGVEYTVTILDNGFEYQGRRYKSLTGVAKAITGTHWSGPVFFGLKKGVKR